MKRMLFLLCGLWGMYVNAAEEFDDTIPVELAKTFLNIGNIGNMQDVGIYRDIMEGFPEFAVPENFMVLGSLDQGIMQRVVLETTVEREEAGTLLFEALAENGWIEIPVPEITQPRGFVPSGASQSYGINLNLCHDDLGNMSLTVFDNEETRLVSLMQTNRAMMFNAFQPGCEEQIAQQQNRGMRGMGRMQGGVMEHMPELQMPETEVSRQPMMGFFGGGGGGSTNDWETRANIAIDWDIEDLYRHFEEQVTAQGWAPDSQWSGTISAGGNWTKSPEADLDLAAMLTIVKTGEENYELKLRVFTLSGGQGGANIRSGIQSVIVRDAPGVP